MELTEKEISNMMYKLMYKVTTGEKPLEYFNGMLNAYISVGALNEYDVEIFENFYLVEYRRASR